MGRPPGKKNKSTGRRFKPYEGCYPDDKHLRLTKNMLESPAYKGLSSNAKVLYAYMKMWACGRDKVSYSASMTNELMTPKTHRRARDELVKEGFIEFINSYRARDLRETAEYEFSDKWYTKTFRLLGGTNGE